MTPSLLQIPIEAPVHTFRHPAVFHLILWAAFIVGMAVNIFMRAWVVIASHKNNITTIGGFFKSEWGPILARSFLLVCFFGLWNIYPQMLTKAAQGIANTLSAGTIKSMLVEFGVPLNPPIAGFVGWCGDSALDKLCTRYPGIAAFLHLPSGPSNAPDQTK